MKCKDLVKIIQDLNLEDYDIFGIDLDYMFKIGDISVGTNCKQLPYPQYKDIFTHLPAESYDQVSVEVSMKNGSIIRTEKEHFDTSNEELYPY